MKLAKKGKAKQLLIRDITSPSIRQLNGNHALGSNDNSIHRIAQYSRRLFPDMKKTCIRLSHKSISSKFKGKPMNPKNKFKN